LAWRGIVLSWINGSTPRTGDARDVAITTSLTANHLPTSELTLVTILWKCKRSPRINCYYNLHTPLAPTGSLLQAMEIAYQDGHERSWGQDHWRGEYLWCVLAVTWKITRQVCTWLGLCIVNKVLAQQHHRAESSRLIFTRFYYSNSTLLL
jgi:hypothetical protein